MGISLSLKDASIFIPEELHRKLMIDICALNDPATLIKIFKKKKLLFSDGTILQRVMPDFYLFDTIDDIFGAWGWQVDKDAHGNIVGLSHIGVSAGDEEILFHTMAKYVNEGSFIEIEYEDEKVWRWEFHGEKVSRKRKKIIYEKSNIKMKYFETFQYIRILSLHESFYNPDNIIDSLKLILKQAGLPILGYVDSREYVQPFESLNINNIFKNDFGHLELALSIKPCVTCDIRWYSGPFYYIQDYPESKVQFCFSVGKGFEPDFSKNLFKLAISQTFPWWGELNFTNITKEHTFYELNQSWSCVPSLGTVNYLRNEIVDKIGGFDKIKKAGFKVVEPLDNGLYVEIPQVSTNEEFLELQETIQRNLSAGSIVQFGESSEGPNPLFNLPEWETFNKFKKQRAKGIKVL